MLDLTKSSRGPARSPRHKSEVVNAMDLASAKPRRILLAVTGNSPAIVTETLYALAVTRDPAFIPTEIHIVSTSRGLQSIRDQLLTHPGSPYHRLLEEYALPGPIRFDESTLHGIRSSGGDILPDINSKADNEAAADHILAIVRELASDPDSAIHATIAGGRKTMGFLMGYAMSMLGRSQDSLSHVLVSEPFEQCESFYYPPREAQTFQTKSGQSVCSTNAEIMLAEIPFLRLGHKRTLRMVQAGDGYSETVQRLQDAIDEPQLAINIDGKTITAHGRKFSLSSNGIALLSLFAIRTVLNRPSLLISGNESAAIGQLLPVLKFVDIAKIDSVYQLVAAEDSKPARTKIVNLLSRYRTRLNEDLEEKLGELADHYLIATSDDRPVTYSWGLKPEQIEITCEGIDQLIDSVRFEMEEPE